MNSKFGRWSKAHDFCIQCGQNSTRHLGGGLCQFCYLKKYRENPEKKDRIRETKLNHYRKTYTPEKLKEKREREHFGGNREAALARDGYRCVRCFSEKKLTVHHKDRTGRGVDSGHNHDLSNLETLCRRCHIEEHRAERVDSYRKNRIYK